MSSGEPITSVGRDVGGADVGGPDVGGPEVGGPEVEGKEVVTGPGVPPAIGPYSQGVRAGGFLYVSGQPGLDHAKGQVAGPTMGQQARQALRNLGAVLEAGGSRPDLVVSATVMITDFAAAAEMNQAFAEFFAADPPARITFQTSLPSPFLISIGCVALIG